MVIKEDLSLRNKFEIFKDRSDAGQKLAVFLKRYLSNERNLVILAIPRGGIPVGCIVARELNVDFSGGELKISELMQLIALDPKVLILDEIDSGLDIQKIKRVANLIRKYFIKKSKALLLITHTGQIMKYIKPSKVYVMLDGKIVCTSNNWKKVWEIVNKYGYEKCKKCKLSSSE